MRLIFAMMKFKARIIDKTATVIIIIKDLSLSRGYEKRFNSHRHKFKRLKN